jgi:hypothetical protein
MGLSPEDRSREGSPRVRFPDPRRCRPSRLREGRGGTAHATERARRAASHHRDTARWERYTLSASPSRQGAGRPHGRAQPPRPHHQGQDGLLRTRPGGKDHQPPDPPPAGRTFATGRDDLGELGPGSDHPLRPSALEDPGFPWVRSAPADSRRPGTGHVRGDPAAGPQGCGLAGLRGELGPRPLGGEPPELPGDDPEPDLSPSGALADAPGLPVQQEGPAPGRGHRGPGSWPERPQDHRSPRRGHSGGGRPRDLHHVSRPDRPGSGQALRHPRRQGRTAGSSVGGADGPRPLRNGEPVLRGPGIREVTCGPAGRAHTPGAGVLPPLVAAQQRPHRRAGGPPCLSRGAGGAHGRQARRRAGRDLCRGLGPARCGHGRAAGRAGRPPAPSRGPAHGPGGVATDPPGHAPGDCPGARSRLHGADRRNRARRPGAPRSWGSPPIPCCPRLRPCVA